MYGLPKSTEVKRPLPKAQLYNQLGWSASQRERFDADVSRLDFSHWISPRTIPAIAVGNEVKEIFVVDVTLKLRNYDIKNITLLAKSIPQRIIFALRWENEVQLAAYHTKLFVTAWQLISNNYSLLTIEGLTFDAVWSNLISSIGNFVVEQENSLTEQIKINEEKQKLQQQIANLERQMNATKQPRRKRELYNEIKRLKGGEV